MKMNRRSYFGFAAVAVLVLMALAGIGLNVHIDLNPHVAWGQASSYPVLPFVYGANVNGRPSFVPSSNVIDTKSGAASASLTSTPAFDVTVENEHARMVAISFGVTTVPGSSPSMTPVVQESDDGGQNWYKVFAQDGTSFSAITSTGTVTAKDFPVYGDLLRVSYGSATGTTGSLWTFTVTANQAQ